MASCRLKDGFFTKKQGFLSKEAKNMKKHKKSLTITDKGGNL
jgi:hypothetical protein